MRWWVATGLLLLGGLDVAAALLLSPSTAAVFVADPLRPEWGLWVRAVFAVGPGLALSLALATTCAIGAGAVLARQSWGPPLGAILAVLHLPYLVVSLPLLFAARALPEALPAEPEPT